MKANELMIGDWVGYLPTWKNEDGSIDRDGDPNDPIPFKVEMVCWDCVDLDDREGGSFDADDICLYPLPLTREILLKNGFEEILFDEKGEESLSGEPSEIFRHDRYSDKYIIEIGNYSPNFINILWKSFGEDGWEKGTILNALPPDGECLHVHELQHILRTYCIEKEIEL